MVTRICKTCGKEYEACPEPDYSNPYRWQDVACSPECGAAYFAAVLRSRGMFEEAAKFETKNAEAETPSRENSSETAASVRQRKPRRKQDA